MLGRIYSIPGPLARQSDLQLVGFNLTGWPQAGRQRYGRAERPVDKHSGYAGMAATAGHRRR